jgi:hypothetical protein
MQNTLDYILKRYKIESYDKTIQIDGDRLEFPKLLKELGFKKGAEIGTDKGVYAEELCKAGLMLYAIDPWLAYDEYPSRGKQHDFNVNYIITKKKLANYHCEIIKSTSMEALELFEDESLNFVYIDANHDFKYISEDIAGWTKKVKPGGIVCGDDYDWYHKFHLRTDVKDAVNAYVANKRPLFLFKKDRAVNWLFIK